MKRFLAAVMLAMITFAGQGQIVGTNTDPCAANPQSSPACAGYKTYHQFGDDTWVNVPLKFPFPFYGQVFTNSFMFSNGVVGFMSVGQQPWDSFCCSGEPINNSSTRFNYTIIPLNTDLYPQPSSRFWSEGSTTYQKYVWENIGEISNGANLNTFGVEIRPSGYVGINYDKVNIDQQTTSAIVGNAALGEYNVHFHGNKFSTTTVPALIEYTSTGNACYSNPLSSPNCPGYQEAQCTANPLYATTCSGYQTAYFTQQCSANPLYAATCPGYQAAYYTQQCTANPLYAATCPGYAAAYLNQQCSITQLYSTQCPDYAAAYKAQQCSLNALYDTDCPGYAEAYQSQQCLLNSLFNSQCPGYQVAYKNQQCSLNALYAADCTGYSAAYKIQQCTANPLYAADCAGYNVAYKTQQCTISALYATDCPGYAVAYFDSQCLKDSLYNPQCEGYKAAYTIKYLVKSEPAVITVIAEVKQSDPVAIISTTGDTTIDAAIAPPSVTSTTSIISPVANSIAPSSSVSSVISVATPVAPSVTSPAAAEKQAEQKADAKKTDTAVAGVEKKASGDPKAARAEAGAKAKEIANNIAKATTMEQQTAQQGLVVGLIGYVPGFSAYQNSIVPDALGSAVAKQYHKPVIDNRSAQRRLSGANEYKWQQIVNSQYQAKD